MDRSRIQADVLLLVAAAIWGFGFVAQRAGMEHLGPFTFNALRFGLGALVLGPILARRRFSPGEIGPAAPPLYPGTTPAAHGDRAVRPVLTGGLVAGVVLFAGASLQQAGIVTTTAGKAGFITGLYVILVPILGLSLGQRPGRGTWAGALLAVCGLYLLSIRGGFAISRGDSLVLIGAFCWAAHVLLIGSLSARYDPLRIAAVQFLTCSLLSLGAALLFEKLPAGAMRRALVPILFSGVISVGIAYTLQVVAQRRTRPSHAAILLSLEAVFAAFGGWLLLGETLDARALTGCALMFAGMMASQIHWGSRAY